MKKRKTQKMSRTDVYRLIDGERDYQDEQRKTWDHQGSVTVEAEILMMEEYMKKVREEWTKNFGPDQAMDQMRKVIAMGVRCLENHGKGKDLARKN